MRPAPGEDSAPDRGYPRHRQRALSPGARERAGRSNSACVRRRSAIGRGGRASRIRIRGSGASATSLSHYYALSPSTVREKGAQQREKRRSREKRSRRSVKSFWGRLSAFPGGLAEGPDLMGTGPFSPELAAQERRLALRCGRLDTSGSGVTPARASTSSPHPSTITPIRAIKSQFLTMKVIQRVVLKV